MTLNRRSLLAAGLALPFAAPRLTRAATATPLRVGVTLHPYHSWVANIGGAAAVPVPLVPVGFNPNAYEPRAEDIRRIGALDVVVLNGIGHDDFAGRMIAASERPDVPVIEANRNVPLLPAVGAFARGLGDSINGRVVNSHTFISIAGAISQVQTIAADLGALHPDHAALFADNARDYNRGCASCGPRRWRRWSRRRRPTSRSPPSTAPMTTSCANSALRSARWSSRRMASSPAPRKWPAPSTRSAA